jgi:DNA adenine methylase
VANDLNKDIPIFFRVLRDRPEEFFRLIHLTPYSRAEHEYAQEDTDDELEQARRFYTRVRQTRLQLDRGSWSYAIAASKSGKCQTISKWLNGHNELARIVARLQMIQFECKPALDVIERYDSPDSFFYCDPPYPASVRGETIGTSQYDMGGDQDHVDLLNLVLRCKGRFLISSYRSPLYDDMLKGWNTVDLEEKVMPSSESGRTNRESLWWNYNVIERLPGF